MKAAIASLLFLGATAVATAQGYVTFQNLFPASSIDAPVFDASGNRIIGPSPYLADLFWSMNTNALMDSLAPTGRNWPFSTKYAGYFFGGAIGGLPSTYILAQVRVWNSSYGSTYYEARDNGGEFGFSNLIVVFPFPPPSVGAYLVGLQGFQLQRLPHLSITPTSTNTLLFTWPTNITTYGLQQSSRLDSTNWITLTNAPLVVGSQNQVTLPKAQGRIFYRLISQ
jgi:hypothetical protein